MARHEWLVLTDADCQPASQQWLRHLAQHMTPDHDFVLGYGAYKPHPGWLNRWVRFETVLTALQYISYARTGIPYMGVGRNLAYRKSLLKKLRPEDLQPHLLSGDDDLLVGRLANAGHVGICLSPEAFTYSSPPDKWPAYFHQKQRHVSTAAHYGRLPQILLSLWGEQSTPMAIYLAHPSQPQPQPHPLLPPPPPRLVDFWQTCPQTAGRQPDPLVPNTRPGSFPLLLVAVTFQSGLEKK
jgi:hypothetical protein